MVALITIACSFNNKQLLLLQPDTLWHYLTVYSSITQRMDLQDLLLSTLVPQDWELTVHNCSSPVSVTETRSIQLRRERGKQGWETSLVPSRLCTHHADSNKIKSPWDMVHWTFIPWNSPPSPRLKPGFTLCVLSATSLSQPVFPPSIKPLNYYSFTNFKLRKITLATVCQGAIISLSKDLRQNMLIKSAGGT